MDNRGYNPTDRSYNPAYGSYLIVTLLIGVITFLIINGRDTPLQVPKIEESSPILSCMDTAM